MTSGLPRTDPIGDLALSTPVGPVTPQAAGGVLAVMIHDVEPRWLDRVRRIREWLLARGVDRVTLLVIPAPDLHPISGRCPGLISWVRGRCAAGDAVAQHGLAHRASLRPPWPRSTLAAWQAGRAAEFPGLDPVATRLRVEMGRRLLREVELDPLGFVAPGYAYTRALRGVLREEFRWFADLGAIHRPGIERVRSPALCLGTSSALKRRLSPAIVHASARSVLRHEGRALRLDIHPADFDLPGHMAVLQSILGLAAGRPATTYDDLLS